MASHHLLNVGLRKELSGEATTAVKNSYLSNVPILCPFNFIARSCAVVDKVCLDTRTPYRLICEEQPYEEV